MIWGGENNAHSHINILIRKLEHSRSKNLFTQVDVSGCSINLSLGRDCSYKGMKMCGKYVRNDPGWIKLWDYLANIHLWIPESNVNYMPQGEKTLYSSISASLETLS